MRLYRKIPEFIWVEKTTLYYLIFLGALLLMTYQGGLATMVMAFICANILCGIMIVQVICKIFFGEREYYEKFGWIFSYVVDRRFRDLSLECKEAKEWCKENCRGKWLYTHAGYFIFRKRDDAMAFTLRWI